MPKYVKSLLYVVMWLVLMGGFGLAYAADKIGVGTLVFLEACALTLGTISVIFWKTSHSPESVEQLLYHTDHPKRT